MPCHRVAIWSAPCHCLTSVCYALACPCYTMPLLVHAEQLRALPFRCCANHFATSPFRCSSFRRPATPLRINALPFSSLTFLRYDMPRRYVADLCVAVVCHYSATHCTVSPRLAVASRSHASPDHATAMLRCSCRCHDFAVLSITIPSHCVSLLRYTFRCHD